MGVVDYDIRLQIEIPLLEKSATIEEVDERLALQIHLDSKVRGYLSNGKNRQNLVNLILGNTGILIP